MLSELQPTFSLTCRFLSFFKDMALELVSEDGHNVLSRHGPHRNGLSVEVCLPSRCLATRWANPLQYLTETYYPLLFIFCHKLQIPVNLKSMFLWLIIVRTISKEASRRFGVTYRIHFQNRIVSKTSRRHWGLFVAESFLGLLFDEEDVGVNFLRNVGGILPKNTAL
jgi:hypothetical protein